MSFLLFFLESRTALSILSFVTSERFGHQQELQPETTLYCNAYLSLPPETVSVGYFNQITFVNS